MDQMMGTNAAVTVPSKLADFGQHREGLIDLLKGKRVPAIEIVTAVLCAREIESDIVEVLTRAASEDLDRPRARLLFRGVHILGDRQCASGYRPLIALLRGPQRRIDYLLGDVVTETLAKILAGVFDGDTEPLLALIADIEVDEFVRDAALGAFAFLVFDGRIERNFAEQYLRHFEQQCTAPAGDMIWHTWMTSVALLGLDHLTDRVHAAFADGRIPLDVADESHYREILAAALARPDDRQRFDDEHLGYIEDVLEELERWPLHEIDSDSGYYNGDDEVMFGGRLPGSDELRRTPVRNPHAGIGRNDPCPCGSGKKFKKCCLR